MSHPNIRDIGGETNGRVAALVYFDEQTTKEEAKRILGEMLNEYAREVERVTVGTYNPQWGSPVWYVP